MLPGALTAMVVCLNKVDLPGTESSPGLDGAEPMRISALTGAGLEGLRQTLAEMVKSHEQEDD